MESNPADLARTQLRAALTPAMRAKDQLRVRVIRGVISAIDNAESKGVQAEAASGAIEMSGAVGGSEAERRILTKAEVDALIQAEATERESALKELGPDAVGQLRDELAVLHEVRAGLA